MELETLEITNDTGGTRVINRKDLETWKGRGYHIVGEEPAETPEPAKTSEPSRKDLKIQELIEEQKALTEGEGELSDSAKERFAEIGMILTKLGYEPPVE